MAPSAVNSLLCMRLVQAAEGRWPAAIHRPRLLPAAGRHEGVEHPHRHALVRGQAQQQRVHPGGVEVVQQQPHAHAAGGGVAQFAQHAAAHHVVGQGGSTAGPATRGPGGSASTGPPAPCWERPAPSRRWARRPAPGTASVPRRRPAGCRGWRRWRWSPAAPAAAAAGWPHPASSPARAQKQGQETGTPAGRHGPGFWDARARSRATSAARGWPAGSSPGSIRWPAWPAGRAAAGAPARR